MIAGLKSIDKNSVDTVITSPPYWSLRDYLTDGQIGMESTLEEYHERLLEVTAHLKRVMKPTGVMFWNHGDSYGGSGGSGGDYDKDGMRAGQPKVGPAGGTPKCLTMQNSRLIIKMIDQQGWILRNMNIWHKPNGMPSSARDRFTNKYEPVYMLTKEPKYHFDLDAIRVPAKYQEVWSRKGSAPGTPYETTGNNPRARWGSTRDEVKSDTDDKSFSMKNPGDVVEMTQVDWINYCYDLWDTFAEKQGDVLKIPTQPHKDAHFAIFPDKLVEPLIKAGCPKDRVVLDPFAGSGTTMKNAKLLGRSTIGIEISEEYCDIIKRNLLFHQYTFGNIVNKFVEL